jgi:hypothetical protein
VHRLRHKAAGDRVPVHTRRRPKGKGLGQVRRGVTLLLPAATPRDVGVAVSPEFADAGRLSGQEEMSVETFLIRSALEDARPREWSTERFAA